MSMASNQNRVYVGRLIGTSVFDPQGDPVGKVRDVVLSSIVTRTPQVLGLVVEVMPRRSIFLPMGRVTAIEFGQVLSTGKVDLRRFSQHSSETLVMAELIDRKVTIINSQDEVVIGDVAIDYQERTRSWIVTKVFVRKPGKGLRRFSEELTLDWNDIVGLDGESSVHAVDSLLAMISNMAPTDLASLLRDLPEERRLAVVAELSDDTLADVLEELPEEDRVELIQHLGFDRVLEVFEELNPDDAADLLKELPAQKAQEIIESLEPSDAEDLKRLISYEDYTAGGMMTTDPVLVTPDTTVASALAQVRNPSIPPALAAQVYVVRSPLETPTGQYLGTVHFQQLLRETPSTLVSQALDRALVPLGPNANLATVARHFAAYNLVALPVVDDAGRLLGAVTVDDLVDHMLPEDWRDTDTEEV
ncbi:MAG: hypothetical protein RIS09_972 [Actinomycetota bacterium]